MHVRTAEGSIIHESLFLMYIPPFWIMDLHRKIVANVSRKYRSNRNKISHGTEWLQTESVACK